jgi:hypothetical protein
MEQPLLCDRIVYRDYTILPACTVQKKNRQILWRFKKMTDDPPAVDIYGATQRSGQPINQPSYRNFANPSSVSNCILRCVMIAPPHALILDTWSNPTHLKHPHKNPHLFSVYHFYGKYKVNKMHNKFIYCFTANIINKM